MRISKKYLRFVVGVLWLGVGVMLTVRGMSWAGNPWELLVVLPLAYAFSQKVLSRVSSRTLSHIEGLKEKTCVFAFQPARSYLMMALMVCLGIFLRNLPIPRSYLGFLYMTMGLALLLASFKFLRYS